jgi:hypothetical protein
MEVRKESIQKQSTNKRTAKKRSSKYDVYDMKLITKRNSQISSKLTLSKENKKIKHHSLVDQPLDSGIDHLEYLKEKNSKARKRLLDLQKRLVELNSKGKSIYKAEDLKFPNIFEHFKDLETLTVMQKYSSVSLAPGHKNAL